MRAPHPVALRQRALPVRAAHVPASVMADGPRCNAPTMAGGRCQWDIARCKFDAHARWRAAQPVAFAGGTVFEAPPLVPPATVFEQKDLRGLAWWVLEQVITGRLESPRASVAATLMRVIAALGEQDLDDEEYMRRQQLGGLMLHGMPPETPEQWALARQMYAPPAIEMLERWAAKRGTDLSQGAGVVSAVEAPVGSG